MPQSPYSAANPRYPDKTPLPSKRRKWKRIVTKSGVKNGALDSQAISNHIHSTLRTNIDNAMHDAVTFHLGHEQWEPQQIAHRCRLLPQEKPGLRIFYMDDVALLKIRKKNPYLYQEGRQRHLAKFSQSIIKLY